MSCPNLNKITCPSDTLYGKLYELVGHQANLSLGQLHGTQSLVYTVGPIS